MLVLHPHGVARHPGLVAVLAVRIRDTGTVERLQIAPFLSLHTSCRAVVLRISRLDVPIVAHLAGRALLPRRWRLGLMVVSRGKRTAHVVVG